MVSLKPNSFPLSTLAVRSAQLREEYDTWHSKNFLQKALTRRPFNIVIWKMDVQSLFNQALFADLDENPSFKNLELVILELDKFKSYINFNSLVLIWSQISSRSHMAGKQKSKIDEMLRVQILEMKK